MAARAKPAKKPGAGKSAKEQINGLDKASVREHFDSLHGIQDEQDEVNATFRGRINRVYDKACKDLDVSKDALKMVYQEERQQRKKAANAAKMDTRGRDSMARFGAALGDTPMGQWATRLSSVKPATVESETKVTRSKASKKPAAKKKAAPPAAENEQQPELVH